MHERTELMSIRGRFSAPLFLPWISRHAGKLGLRQEVEYSEENRIELRLSGPEELISAMEMGCLLGPIDVWVDEVQRRVA